MALRLRALVQAFLVGLDGGRPAAFDEGEDGPDFRVRKNLAQPRHGALEAGRRQRPAAQLGVVEEHLVGMVPSVAAGVVRRRRKGPVGQPPAPVGLAFEVGAVAAGALRGVYLAAHGDHFGIAGVGAGGPAGDGVDVGADDGGGSDAAQDHDNHACFRHWRRFLASGLVHPGGIPDPIRSLFPLSR